MSDVNEIPCESIRPWAPRGKSLQLVNDCLEVLHELEGYRLTLRQLYYQLVTRNILPNKRSSYVFLSQIVTRARMAGLIPWECIEDRVRVPRRASEFSDLSELVEAALASYRLPRWNGQGAYCELWVEKDALASVLWPIARDYHVVLMVNRGYSSASAMKDAAGRFTRDGEGKNCILIYVGDFDPSGEDMVRDIRERLGEFDADVDLRKIALTYDQVEQYRLPPNPAKMSDTRARAFVKRYGASSYEVDALPPAELTRLITTELNGIVDREAMNAVMQAEEFDRRRLRRATEAIIGRG